MHHPQREGVPDLVDAARWQAGALPHLDRAIAARPRQEVPPGERPRDRKLRSLHQGRPEVG